AGLGGALPGRDYGYSGSSAEVEGDATFTSQVSTFPIPLLQDTPTGSNESFTVQLSNPQGYTEVPIILGNPVRALLPVSPGPYMQETVTLAEQPAPTVQIDPAGAGVTEGGVA